MHTDIESRPGGWHVSAAEPPGRWTPLLVVLFAVAICFAVAATEGLREWRARDAALDEIQRAATNLARSLAQHAEDTLEVVDTALIGLVERVERAEPGGTELEDLGGLLSSWAASVPRLRSLAVTGPDGRVLASSIRPLKIGQDRSHRDYFLHHKEVRSRAPFLGQPIQAQSDGSWVITLSRRIDGPDGSFKGVANAAIDVRYFADFYAQFSVGKEGSIALLNRDGMLLTRFPFELPHIGKTLPSASSFVRRLAREQGGTLSYRSPFDGVARLTAYRVGSTFPLVVMAAVGREEALAEWRAQATWRVAAAGALILLIASAGFGLAHQIRRRSRADQARYAAETRFRLMAENSSDMLCRIDPHGIRTYVSPASRHLLGMEPEELVGGNVLDRVAPEDRARIREVIDELRAGAAQAKLSYRTRHKNGSEVWLETTVRVLHDPLTGERDGVVTSSRDVTDRKDLERQLRELARTDALTDLANRRSFDEALTAEWHRAARTGTPLSLVLLDVDRFKLFNDSYGHRAGDECLQIVAASVRGAAGRPGDLVARYGGEEIALLLPGTDAAGAYAIAEAARRAVQDNALRHTENVPFGVVTASAGVATAQLRAGAAGQVRPDNLVEAADQALYQAKQDGRNRVAVSPALREGHARLAQREAA